MGFGWGLELGNHNRIYEFDAGAITKNIKLRIKGGALNRLLKKVRVCRVITAKVLTVVVLPLSK